ncbi:MAG: 1-acyl-sn-glycerol-3-phosphate acyltransferase [Acidimicrobiales bacterium]
MSERGTPAPLDEPDAREVLDVVSRLLDQLGVHGERPLTLDSDLTTDLGADSLALVELLDRLEDYFGVSLPDEALMTATTPRGWLDALRSARRIASAEAIAAVAEVDAHDLAARPESYGSITHPAGEIVGAPDQVVPDSPDSNSRGESGMASRSATSAALAAGAPGRARIRAGRPRRHRAWPVLRRPPRARPERRPTPYGSYALFIAVPTAVAALAISFAPVTPQRRAAWAEAVVRAVCRLLGIRFTVEGRFPEGDEPFIAIANHASFLDAVALYATVPGPATFVSSVEIERTPILGATLRRFGCVFVQRGRADQGAAAVSQLVDVLRRGRRLALFPEGSLSEAQGLRPFRLGAFDAAATAGCPVVPIGVRGTRGILSPGSRWPRRGAIHVVVGEPLRAAGSDFAAKVSLRDAARRRVAELCGEESLASP